MSAEVSIGLVVLLAVISMLMAIAWAAGKGGPMLAPLSVIILAIAVILIRLGHAG